MHMLKYYDDTSSLILQKSALEYNCSECRVLYYDPLGNMSHNFDTASPRQFILIHVFFVQLFNGIVLLGFQLASFVLQAMLKSHGTKISNVKKLFPQFEFNSARADDDVSG